ncbi:hypothetical protein D3C84_1142020 [compost metagenome]
MRLSSLMEMSERLTVALNNRPMLLFSCYVNGVFCQAIGSLTWAETTIFFSRYSSVPFVRAWSWSRSTGGLQYLKLPINWKIRDRVCCYAIKAWSRTRGRL